MSYSVAFDATPLAAEAADVSEHTLRGIGTYVDGILRAIAVEQTSWAEQHLRPAVTHLQARPAVGRPILTRRPRWRRQEVGWLSAWLADRIAIRRAGLALACARPKRAALAAPGT